MEDRNFDSQTQPKRPRVFFTEDQKDSLRQAYAQDPYPNQSTIETLAKSLNVGVKTVINWFHNHRMRAKQQHHAGGDMAIKSEPDESSNQSDLSSMSGDVTLVTSSGQIFHGGVTPTDVNQWIFPHFEALAHKRKVPSVNIDNEEDNKENNGGLEDEDGDEMDEPDGLDTTTHAHNNNKEKVDSSIGTNVSRITVDDGNKGRIESDDRTESSHNLADSVSDNHSNSISVPSASNNIGGSVNKRKRSNPQRVYEGVQLDWIPELDRDSASNGVTENTTDASSEQEMSHEEQPISSSINTGGKLNSQEKMNGDSPLSEAETVPSELSKKASTQAASCSSLPNDRSESDHHIVHRIKKIEKIQKAIKSAVETWDDDDDENPGAVSSIEKIQKHLESKSSDDDWEF